MQSPTCAVCASARHTQWSETVLSRLQGDRFEGWRLPRLPSEPSAAAAAAARCEPQPVAVLLFATPDSVEWAARAVAALRPGQVPVVAVVRGLGAAAIERLLDAGARDFLWHLFDPQELLARLDRLQPAPTPRAVAPTTPHDVRRDALAPLVGRSPAFVAQVQRIPVLAACHASVLVVGDTGTGKELAARAIHYLSARADGPWIAVNCAALPGDLLEAELFGRLRGAYTSADSAREGLVAEAERGTLFLDEIDSLPPQAQAKLLRFLQSKEYRPLGGAGVRRADVRVVAAANGDLAAGIASGSFRRDLYYRLNVLTIRLPALRERPEDIPLLAGHFAARYAREFEHDTPAIAPAALRSLQAHDWPGNVRELEHCIERAVLLCSGTCIEAADLGLPAPDPIEGRPDPGTPFSQAKATVVEQFERQFIEQALRRCHGNITQAAAVAAKNRRAFWEMMRKYDIDANAFRPG